MAATFSHILHIHLDFLPFFDSPVPHSLCVSFGFTGFHEYQKHHPRVLTLVRLPITWLHNGLFRREDLARSLRLLCLPRSPSFQLGSSDLAGKMKFGQNLPRNQVPEWARSYIDYKALKKLIKTAQTAIDEEEEPDLAGTVPPGKPAGT